MMQRVQSPRKHRLVCDPPLSCLTQGMWLAPFQSQPFDYILQFEFPATAVQDYLWHSLDLSPMCCATESVLCPCPFTHRRWMKEHSPSKKCLPASRQAACSFLIKCHITNFLLPQQQGIVHFCVCWSGPSMVCLDFLLYYTRVRPLTRRILMEHCPQNSHIHTV